MPNNFLKKTSPWSYIVLGLVGYGLIMSTIFLGKSCGGAGSNPSRTTVPSSNSTNGADGSNSKVAEAPSDSSAGFTITRPLNGESLSKKDSEKGLSEINIENNGDVDAVIKLVDAKTEKTYRHSYVHAGRVLELKSIKAGDYWIKFSTGRDYSAEKRGFTSEVKFMIFEDSTPFTERRDEGRQMYTQLRITLFPVKGGNARARPISEDEFADK